MVIQPGEFPGKVANFPLRRGDVVVMESSGGGGFGEPTERDRAALELDLANGYVTAAGRGAYDEAALVVMAVCDAAVKPGACLLSERVAMTLGAAEGDLVELTVAAGPARRFWVVGTGDAEVACAGFGGACRVRRLGRRP